MAATTPNTLSTSEYWMSPDALTIELNALDNPQYLQVSLLAGSVITAYRQDVIEYDASLNYRKWALQAYNNFFDRTDRAYVYAQLEKEGTTALIIYSYDILELTGTVTDSSGNSFDVYNIFLATISPSVNISGESIMRTWETAFDTGSLNTDKNRNEEQLGEWAKMFRLNKVTDMIEVLKDITEAVIHRLKIGARKILITDVFTSSEEDISRRTDDQSVPTTKFLQDFTDSRFLSKIKEDKTEYLLRLLGGILSPYIQSPDFVTGPMGAGFTLKQNADGQSYAEVDKLLVRMKAVFQTLSIMETELAGASFMFNASGARATITKVEFIEKKGIRFKDGKGVKFSDGKRGYSSPGTYGSVYRCYFLADDGEKAIENRFKPGNLVRSQSFNIKEGAYDGVSNHYWWRLVENVGDNWIDVSVNHCDEGSDIPKVGDVMVQLGDIADPDYQAAIVLSAYGDGAPYLTFYQGINSYSLSERDILTARYDRVTKECRFQIGHEGKNGCFLYSPSKGLRVEGMIEVLGGNGMSNFDDALDFAEQVNDRMAQYIGYDGWESLVGEALAGRTIIKGGVINTDLINAAVIITSELIAGAIKAKKLEIGDGKKIYSTIDTDGRATFVDVTAINGYFEDVLMRGSLRSPFSKVSDSFNTNYNDNIIIEGGGSWTKVYSIPTGKEQIGRKITVCCIGTGEASISSSNAKFYEYGRSYNELILNKEIVQLIGYGLGDTFYGWIVTCREDLDVNYAMGRPDKVLARGYVDLRDDSKKYYTFDGSTLSFTKVSSKEYRVTMPTQWGTVKDEYMVMVTPMMRVGLSSGTYYVSIESDTEFSLNYMAYGTGQGGAFFFEVKRMGFY